MTRAEICRKVREEIEVWEANGLGELSATAEDFEVLVLALDGIVDECREFLENRFSSEMKES
jgi:hypothetical protein